MFAYLTDKELTMNIDELQGDKYILWGFNSSLYSGKIRPYLIKKGIDFIELNPSHPHFNEIISQHVGHFTVPVIETPEGEILADSTEAMEFLEERFQALPMLPDNKIMAALAHLIHSYGSEGLHKPAMYYRWNTSFSNRCFIIDEFSRASETKEARDISGNQKGRQQADYFRGYLPPLGIGLSNDVDKAIEESTGILYDVLNKHFLNFPYILGGVPSLADYGLMGPLYAHLGRDPASAGDLKLRAPALYRWIETMGRAQIIDPEIWHFPQEFFSPESIPESLIDFISLICADYGTEILSTANLYHSWLNEKERPGGTVISHDQVKANHQILGPIACEQQGVTINRMALIDSLTQHQRFVNAIEVIGGSDRDLFEELMKRTGGAELAKLRLQRSMQRRDFAYVLV
jgi:glutathione S-transferase